ncbi:MAG: hypothetical protein U9O87_08005 [Verrucomicrobiota bacterium]|nr:hypothetical protein [Verrucomicrobiota bacterium]
MIWHSFPFENSYPISLLHKTLLAVFCIPMFSLPFRSFAWGFSNSTSYTCLLCEEERGVIPLLITDILVKQLMTGEHAVAVSQMSVNLIGSAENEQLFL